MNKKIIISLSVIGAVAAIAVGGTIAYFSDTETSQGNTFTAGELDLQVDSTCHYNGNVCALGDCDNDSKTPPTYCWQGLASYPVPGTACECTWLLKDLDEGDLFFDFDDVKPGDSGENTISLHAYDNDAWLCAYVQNLEKDDNGCNEPETAAGDTGCGDDQGELQDYILMTIWEDTDCDNILDEGTEGYCTGEPPCDPQMPQEICEMSGCTWVPAVPAEQVLVNNVPIDSNDGVWSLGQLIASQTECLGVGWNVPGTTDNIIQSDSVTGDIAFYVEQVRNNPDFRCSVPE